MNKSSKIGIVTHYCANNFGAVLQSKALVDAISFLFPNSECNVLDYHHKKRLTKPTIKTIYCLKKGAGIIGKIKGIMHVLIFLLTYIRAAGKTPTQNFIDAHVQRDKSVSLSRDNKLNISNEYTMLICGSDQIWAFWCLLPYYLLETVRDSNIIKIAYAPSFGDINKLKSSQLDYLVSSLKTFSGISCREEDGAKLISKLTGCLCPILPDPTLLHEREYWLKLAKKPRNFPYKEKEFVFTYRISFMSNVSKIASKTARKLKLPLVTCELVEPHSFYSKIGPQEFLWCIANAAHVVTASFHGTVFSLIMGTPFHVVKSFAPQNRMLTLLKRVGLEDRLITCFDEMNFSVSNVFSSELRASLAQMKNEGLEWLKLKLHPLLSQ